MAGGALPGFRDFYPDEFARRAHIFRAWREVARRYAFVEYDGPPLEPLELYTRKSGDEIVGQLYAFKDKGDRDVALRPEMTPTFARMVAERAQALRKPIRWFSIPQLFRYERQQKGRLKEHFQLNVDIVGEPSELADAELLAVAIDCMRRLGLTPKDVRARVSDRALLNAVLATIGVASGHLGAVYAVLDKFGRQPLDVSREKLDAAGLSAKARERVLVLPGLSSIGLLRREVGKDSGTAAHLDRFERYLSHVAALGVGDWVDVDMSIVRGLAYYTGTVFELFDAKGELRAICGGGRYDTLLKDLGGVDLPALGFGMGDVVLGELLTQRNLWPTFESDTSLYLIGGPGAGKGGMAPALKLVSALRGAGLSVDYSMNEDRYMTQQVRNQGDAARKSGALAAIFFDEGGRVVAQGLAGKVADAPTQSFSADDLISGKPAALHDLRKFLDSL